jgi:hypothetical protein
MNTFNLTGQANSINATPSNHPQQTHPQGEARASPYIQPVVLHLLARYQAKRVLCVGRGNEKLHRALQNAGCIVANSESSTDGHAAETPASAALAGYGCCDMIVSTEIHEPFFKPALLIKLAAQHLPSDGILLLSIPYHGYLKHLFITLWEIWEKYCPLWWDSTHLEPWLTTDGLKPLLESNGFTILESIGVRGAARQWETVILLARKDTGIAR